MWPSLDLSHFPVIFNGSTWLRSYFVALLFCSPRDTPNLWTNVTPQLQRPLAVILLHSNDFLLFLTFHIQKTNATFSIHYATEE